MRLSRAERRRVIIDAAQQHGLAEHRNPRIDEAGAGSAPQP
jgi:hypothetical protein